MQESNNEWMDEWNNSKIIKTAQVKTKEAVALTET